MLIFKNKIQMKCQIFIYIIFLIIKIIYSMPLIDKILIDNSFIKQFNAKSNLTYEINNLNLSQNIINWIANLKKIRNKNEYIKFNTNYDQKKGGNSIGEYVLLRSFIEKKKKMVK